MVAFVTHGYGVFPYLHCRFAVHKLQGLILSKLGHHCIFLETRCLGRDSSCSWLPFITLPLRLWQRAMTIRHACCGHYSQGASDLVGFRECTRRLNFSGLPKMRESHHTHSQSSVAHLIVLSWAGRRNRRLGAATSRASFRTNYQCTTPTSLAVCTLDMGLTLRSVGYTTGQFYCVGTVMRGHIDARKRYKSPALHLCSCFCPHVKTQF